MDQEPKRYQYSVGYDPSKNTFHWAVNWKEKQCELCIVVEPKSYNEVDIRPP